MQQFETQRLVLRGWQPARDARHAMDIYGESAVTKWIGEADRDSSVIQVQRRLQRYLDREKTEKNGTGSWAVVQKDIGRTIGHVMLVELPDLREVRAEHTAAIDPEGLPAKYIEIGWHFRPASWGYGYATEAAFRVAQHGFEALDLPLLLAVTDPDNQRSAAVAERLGMTYDGLTARYYGGRALSLYKLTAENLAAARVQWQDRPCEKS